MLWGIWLRFGDVMGGSSRTMYGSVLLASFLRGVIDMSCGSALRGVLGVDNSSGKKEITGIHTQNGAFHDLRCVNLWVDEIKTGGSNSSFPDGTVSAPGIAFTSELSTGIYRPADGVLGFSGTGANLATLNSTGFTLSGQTISTVIGDLVLNPAGSNVDFSGKTLVNVGGISTNPNRYEIVGNEVTTSDATPTVILSIPTVNAAYNAQCDVSVASGTSSGAQSMRLQIKNPSGTVTVNSMLKDRRFDTPLAAAVVNVVVVGTTVQLIAVGIAATTIKWLGAATITRALY